MVFQIPNKDKRLFRWANACLFPVPLVVWGLLAFQLDGTDMLQSDLQNSGHALAFFIVTLCVAFSFQGHALVVAPAPDKGGLSSPVAEKQNSKFFLLWVFLSSLLIGGGVEIVQAWIGRDMSWTDFMLDGLGALAGVFVYLAYYRYSYESKISQSIFRRPVSLLCVASLLLTISFSKPLLGYFGLQKRDQVFPILFDGESYLTQGFALGKYQSRVAIVPAPLMWKENKSKVLKLTAPPSPRWPSFSLAAPVQDWRDYKVLYFEVFSEEKASKRMTFRINDALHNNRGNDRYSERLQVNEGLNRYSILLSDIERAPQHRKIDLQKIQKISWYFDEPRVRNIVYFDNIKLM